MQKRRPKENSQNMKARIKKTMEIRRSEKVAENLEKGWNALKRGNTKAGLSLYLQAVTVYRGNFNAVRIELITAKRKGFLPDRFAIPKNEGRLKNILKKNFDSLKGKENR